MKKVGLNDIHILPEMLKDRCSLTKQLFFFFFNLNPDDPLNPLSLHCDNITQSEWLLIGGQALIS